MRAVRKVQSAPSVVARYGYYTISKGTREGHFYVFLNDIYIGMSNEYDDAVSLIALREGDGFDPDRVEVCDGNC